MNSSNPKFERDFESFLRGDDSRLQALYRKLPTEEPDARLDAAVHALAHRAVAQPRPHMRTRARWLPVSAAAAVVLIAAGIVLRIAPQMQQRPAPMPETAPTATLRSLPAASPQPESAPAAGSPAAAAAPTPPPETPPPELHRLEAAPKPAPRAFPAPVMRKAEPASAAAEAKTTTPAPAPAPPMAAAQMRAESADAESAAAAPARNFAVPAARDRNASLYPEHWLANIRQMLRDDRREEALRSLAEFRKRYPTYRLPDDLRDLH